MGKLWKTCGNVDNSMHTSTVGPERKTRTVSIEAIARQGGLAFWCAGIPFARPSGRMQLPRGVSSQRIAAILSPENLARSVLRLAMMAAINEARQHWSSIWPISRPFLLGATIHRPVPAEHKPDLDNYLKFIADAGSKLLWADDRLLVGYLPGTMKYHGARHGVSVIVLPTTAQTPMRHYLYPLSIEGREAQGARA